MTVPYDSPPVPINLGPSINGVSTALAISTPPAHGAVTMSGNTISYTPQTGYSGPDTFSYTASGPGGTSAPAAVSLTVAAPLGPGGTLTITQSSLGPDASYTFVSTVAGAATFTLTTVGGRASKTMSGLASGPISVTQAGAPAGYQLQSVQCNGVAQSGGTASVTIANGATVSCTFTSVASTDTIQSRTSSTIRNFMRDRASGMASAEPDTQRRHARLQGSLAGDEDDDATPPSKSPRAPVSGPGDGAGPISGAGRFSQAGVGQRSEQAASQPMTFSGNVTDGNGQVSFSTSLSQIRQARRDKDAADRMALGGAPLPSAPTRPPIFDVWVEAHTSLYTDNTAGIGRKGNLDLVYLGADALLGKAVLVGALVQFDRAANNRRRSAHPPAAPAGWRDRT